MRNLLVTLLCLLHISMPAFGQDTETPPPKAVSDEGPVENFEMERGLYLSGNLGVFLTFAGVRANSNIQPYESINFGYDLNDMFSLEFSVSFGHSSSNARLQTEGTASADCGGGLDAEVPDTPIYDQRLNGGLGGCSSYPDFTLSMGQLSFIASIHLDDRIALEVKAGGGGTFGTPRPGSSSQGSIGGNVGGGLGIRYLTLLTDFTVGVEATFTYHFPWGIPALAVSPVVRYTF